MASYDPVAHLYDAYVTVDRDLDFFRREAEGAMGPVLEIMAGTGRVSAALAAPGRHLICLDASAGMLAVLRGKTPAWAGRVDLVCADARGLPLADGSVGLALIPFNSFGELTSEEGQRRALAGIARCLRPSGRFVCTLHNPPVRSRTLDGVERSLGRFPLPAGPARQVDVRIEGSLRPGTALARSRQSYLLLDGEGRVVQTFEQVVDFALVEPEALLHMAVAAGLAATRTYGDYDRSPFDPASSPYMIAVFERP